MSRLTGQRTTEAVTAAMMPVMTETAAGATGGDDDSDSEGSGGSTDSGSSGGDGFGPGWGACVVVTGLCSAGYLLRRRQNPDET